MGPDKTDQNKLRGEFDRDDQAETIPFDIEDIMLVPNVVN